MASTSTPIDPRPHDGAGLGADLAHLTEVGARGDQCDAVRISANADGSWVIAVADGTGSGIGAEEVAPAAVATLPGHIASEEEMLRGFDAANLAARQVAPNDTPYRLGEDMPAICAREPETTLAVAAWTPEGGLLAAWVGDTMVFVVPLDGGRGWHGAPHNMREGARLIGEFASHSSGPPASLCRTIRSLRDDMGPDEVSRMISGGATVAVLSDGAYNAYMGLRYGRWFSDDPEDNSIGFLLSRKDRLSAERAALAIMRRARRHGLHDNTTVAVARIPPPLDV